MSNKYPDSITLDSGKTVRVSTMNPNATLKIHGRTIRVADIPLVAVRLKCGCVVRGIAIAKRDIVFCENHHDESYVTEVLAK